MMQFVYPNAHFLLKSRGLLKWGLLKRGLLKFWVFVLGGVLVAGGVGHAQVVQLPSFHSFGISTAVSVPDGGSTSLGGYGYAANGSNSNGFGPYSTRAGGGRMGGGSVSVGVQVIDLQAMDEAILGGSHSNSASDSKRNVVSTNPRQATPGNAVRDSGAWQRVMAAGAGDVELPSASEAEISVRYYLQRAAAAEQQNRVNSARVYYEMALKAMTPQLMQRYQRILANRAQEAEAKQKAEASKPIARF